MPKIPSRLLLPTEDEPLKVIEGDCLKVLPTLPERSVSAIVTDPPAGIAFMGKAWDGNRGGRDRWIAWLAERMIEARRVIRPGGYALVWALPRTSHWTATALEDAGWEIRDRIAHIFGQGFPKGRGCLKPAVEDWWLCRAPGKKVLPLGIDECRIPGRVQKGAGSPGFGEGREDGYELGTGAKYTDAGRWPANLVLDEAAAAELDRQSGDLGSGYRPNRDMGLETQQGQVPFGTIGTRQGRTFPDSGGASRFFYCPKASRKDRGDYNTHPTVKSVELMRWLIKLICPPGEIVLDLFAGSGSTGVAANEEKRRCLLIESDPESAARCRERVYQSQRLYEAPQVERLS